MKENTTNQAGCPEAVAFDLVRAIAIAEQGTKIAEMMNDPRKYYLDLYGECLTAVRGQG